MLHRGSLVTADADSIAFEPEYHLVLLVVSDLVTLLVTLSWSSCLYRISVKELTGNCWDTMNTCSGLWYTGYDGESVL